MIFFLVILIFFIIFYICYKEKFIIEKFLTFENESNINQDSYLKFKMIQKFHPIFYIILENDIYDSKFNELINKYAYIKKTSNIEEAEISLINSYKLHIDYKNQEILTLIDNPNLCIFFSNNKNFNLLKKTQIDENPQDKESILDKNKINIIPDIKDINNNCIIGYLYDYEIYIIKNILYSCNIDLNSLNIQYLKINTNEIIDTLYVSNKIDIFFYFNTIENPLLNDLLKQDYKLLNYNLSNDKIKALIPFSRVENKILNISLNYNCLLIDNLYYILKDNNNFIEDNIKNYYSTSSIKILNSYYKDFFTFKEINTIETYSNYSDKLELKYTLDNNLIEDIKNDIPDITKQLYYKIYILFDDNKIPIKINDTIIIDNKSISNISLITGKYYVIKVLSDSIIVSKYALIYDIKFDDEFVLSKADSSIDFITPKQNLNLIDNDLVFVISLDKEGIYLNNQIKIINNLDNDFKEKYICFEDHSITNQYICTGNTNINGTQKDKYTWDRPCSKNTECDFYLANKNYRNTNGKCSNGYCELPLGIERKSYRKYTLSDTSYPLCRGCDKNISLKDCCETQKNNKDYKSPDYIF